MKLSADLYRKTYGKYASPRMERRHVIGVTFRQQKKRWQKKHKEK